MKRRKFLQLLGIAPAIAFIPKLAVQDKYVFADCYSDVAGTPFIATGTTTITLPPAKDGQVVFIDCGGKLWEISGSEYTPPRLISL